MTRINLIRDLILICSSVILGTIFNVVVADQSSVFPGPRFRHSSVLKGSTLYFIGGVTNSDSPFYSLDVSHFATFASSLPRQLSFTNLSPTVNNFPFTNDIGLDVTPVVLCGPESDQVIYTFTNESPQVIISIYNITSRAWDNQRQIGNWPVTQAICNNRRILLFQGGQDVMTDGNDVITPYELLYYDLVSLTLTGESRADPGVEGLTRPSFVQLTNGNVLVIGGKRKRMDGILEYRSMSELNIYDPNTNTWTSTNAIGQVPAGRESFSLSPTQDGRLILYGGINNVSTNPISPDIAVLDTTSNPFSWSTPEIVSPIPSRYSHTANVVGNSLIVAFGLIIQGKSSIPTSELHVLDISTASKFIWIQSYSHPPFPITDQSAMSRVDNPKIWRRSTVTVHKPLFITLLITFVVIVILLVAVIIFICRRRIFHDDLQIEKGGKYDEDSPSIISMDNSTTSHDDHTPYENETKDNKTNKKKSDTPKFVIVDGSKRPNPSTYSETGPTVRKSHDKEYQSISETARANTEDAVNVGKRGVTPNQENNNVGNVDHTSRSHVHGLVLNGVISAYNDYWDEEETLSSENSENSSAPSTNLRTPAQSVVSSISVATQRTQYSLPTDRRITPSHSSQYSLSSSSSLHSPRSPRSITPSSSSRLITLPSSPRDGFLTSHTLSTTLSLDTSSRKSKQIRQPTESFVSQITQPTESFVSQITLNDSDRNNESATSAKQSESIERKSSAFDFIGTFGNRKTRKKQNDNNNNNNNNKNNNLEDWG